MLGHYKSHSWFPSTTRMPSRARLEAGIDSEIFNALSHVVACCAMASEMPTIVTVSIYNSSCSRMLLECTISDEDD